MKIETEVADIGPALGVDHHVVGKIRVDHRQVGVLTDLARGIAAE